MSSFNVLRFECVFGLTFQTFNFEDKLVENEIKAFDSLVKKHANPKVVFFLLNFCIFKNFERHILLHPYLLFS